MMGYFQSGQAPDFEGGGVATDFANARGRGWKEGGFALRQYKPSKMKTQNFARYKAFLGLPLFPGLLAGEGFVHVKGQKKGG